FRTSEIAVDCYFAALTLRTVSRRCLPLYYFSMVHKQVNNSLRIVCSLGLLGLTLIASSCGHAAASPAPVALDVVMKTIHESPVVRGDAAGRPSRRVG